MARATSRELHGLRGVQRSFCLLSLGLPLALSACAGASSSPAPRDARAAGGLPSYRPVTLREFAYGSDGSSRSAVGARDDSSGAELEAFLGPTAPLSKVHAPRAVSGARALSESARARIEKRPSSATLALVSATASSNQTALEPQGEVAPIQKASPQETRNYAAREARSQAQQQYRGGNVVVIGVSTLVIVLLIVLLVVLLIR